MISPLENAACSQVYTSVYYTLYFPRVRSPLLSVQQLPSSYQACAYLTRPHAGDAPTPCSGQTHPEICARGGPPCSREGTFTGEHPAPSQPSPATPPACAGLHDPRIRTGYGISHGLLAFVLNFRLPVPILFPSSYPTRYPVP